MEPSRAALHVGGRRCGCPPRSWAEDVESYPGSECVTQRRQVRLTFSLLSDPVECGLGYPGSQCVIRSSEKLD